MADIRKEIPGIKGPIPPVEVDGVPVPLNQRRGWMMGYDGPMWYPGSNGEENIPTTTIKSSQPSSK